MNAQTDRHTIPKLTRMKIHEDTKTYTAIHPHTHLHSCRPQIKMAASALLHFYRRTHRHTHTHFGVTMVLQRFVNVVTMLLQFYYNGVTSVLQGCYSDVTVVLQSCYVAIQEFVVRGMVLQWCYNGVTVVAQWPDLAIQGFMVIGLL
jgi:hypothetical protein